ncbi:MAG TPA: response regulator [Stenomitos sp.]
MFEQQLITILHVDDNETNRYTTNRMLRRAGFNVIEAATGEAALQLVDQAKPDLIILDVRLPGIDGFEVCRRIKANPTTAFIPVLHLSASFVESRDKAQGLNSGADAYLAQPVEPIELIATIKALLRIRQAEESALSLAREWQSTFDAMNDGVCLLNQEGRIVRCNTAISKLLNQPLNECIGCLHQELMPKRLGFVEPTPFTLVQETRQRESHEVQGDSRWFSVTVDPVFDQEIVFTGAVYILADVTERKRAEEERNQLLVREQEARAAAEAANRLKDEFLATLSHELRSPLNAMLGWTRLLNSRKFDEATTVRALQTIERSAKSQAQLVEDLLDVSRIIQGKLRLNTCPVQLVSVIEAVMETVRPAAQAKEIGLQSVLDPTSGLVAGDSDRLQQVIWNLVSNAIKFTPKGGCVQVRLETVNSQVEITVTDTGKGIDPEFVPYVFERFRQADSSSTRVYSGLGLGLAIVRHLVELHGGTVYAHSAGEDKGATFTVKLPRLSVVAEAAHPQHSPRTVDLAVPYENLPALKGVRIVIVDDEPDSRDLLVATLEQCEAKVFAFANAHEALVAVSQLKPDVLVSDIGMPLEDGYSLIRKVRQLPAEQGGHIPAIALTAYARAEDRMKAIASGFQMHIPKPVEPAELATVVASLAKH